MLTFSHPLWLSEKQDSNDHMVDTVGMGYTERRKLNVEIVEERLSYREGFKKMIESVHRPFAEMEELVRRGTC